MTTERTSDRDTRGTNGSCRVYYPEYGPVEGLVGFGLFYLLVDRLTPTLVAELAGPFPDLVPAPFTTATALLLWLFFGTTVGGVVLTHVRSNPRTFADTHQRDAFLDEHRPADWDYRFNLVLMVLGGSTAALAWPTAIEVLRELLPIAVDVGSEMPSVFIGGEIPSVLTIENVAVFVVFFVGFAAYSRGVDRLVVGGMREFLYRYYLDEWG